MKIISRRNGCDSVTESQPFLSEIIFISGKHSGLYCIYYIPSGNVLIKKGRKKKKEKENDDKMCAVSVSVVVYPSCR